MNAPSFTLTNESLTLLWEGKPVVVQKSAPNFQALRSAIIEERWDDIPNHLTVAKSIKEWARGEFTIEDETVSYKGKELPRDLNERIVAMATAGDDPEPLFKFWERLQKNPSWRSVQQLFSFLRHQGIPMTKDGCFLAYKGVTNDLKDCHSHSYDNSPGQVHEMPRNEISDDPNQACHVGFHVGAIEYARTFGPRVVVCKVDPENVVCVPYDANQHKMRVCKYEVVGHWNGTYLPNTFFVDDIRDSVEEKEEVAGIDAEDGDISDEEENCECGDDCGGVCTCDGTTSDDEKCDEECCSDEEPGYRDVPDTTKPLCGSSYSGQAIPCQLSQGHTGPHSSNPEDAEKGPFQRPTAPADPKPATFDGPPPGAVQCPQPMPVRAVDEVKAEEPAKADKKRLKKWQKLDEMGMEKLMEESLDDLRQYAGHGLEIVGASKIPGGKAALVGRILEVREVYLNKSTDK